MTPPSDPIEQLMAALDRGSTPDPEWIARCAPDGSLAAAWRASENPVAMRRLLGVPGGLAWQTAWSDACAVQVRRWRQIIERPRGTHVTITGPRDVVLAEWFVAEDTPPLAAAVEENRRLVDAIRRVVPAPPTLDQIVAGLAASRARAEAYEAAARAEALRDPIASLLAALDESGKPPLAWVVAHAPDGDVSAVIQRAWEASEDPNAMGRLLARADMLERATAHQSAMLEVVATTHASPAQHARTLRVGFPEAPTLAALLSASRPR